MSSSHTATPLVSILLPTWNGEQDLARLLPALATQELPGGFEICAIDSESSDRSFELLLEAGARAERIRKQDFAHGPTRNRIAEMARGKFLVFLSQDVLPADEHFLANLITAFEDERVAGAYSRVLPNPGDDPLTARTVLDLPEASEEPRIRDLAGRGLWELPPLERVEHMRFNNVASTIRADVFREFPFPNTYFAEDFSWAARVVSRGWRIAYVPSSVAYHAHCYSCKAAYERYRIDATFHRLAHGWRMRPNLFSALKGFSYQVRQDVRYIARHGEQGRVKHLLRSPLLRGSQILGQYVGSKRRRGEKLLVPELMADL